MKIKVYTNQNVLFRELSDFSEFKVLLEKTEKLHSFLSSTYYLDLENNYGKFGFIDSTGSYKDGGTLELIYD